MKAVKSYSLAGLFVLFAVSLLGCQTTTSVSPTNLLTSTPHLFGHPHEGLTGPLMWQNIDHYSPRPGEENALREFGVGANQSRVNLSKENLETETKGRKPSSTESSR